MSSTRNDARDHALVAVTAGHLVARLDLALGRDEDLDHLHHARRQFVTALQLVDLVDETLFQKPAALFVLSVERFLLGHQLVVVDGELPPLRTRLRVEDLVVELGARDIALRASRGGLAEQHFLETRIDVAVEDRLLVVAVLGQALDFLALDGHGALVLVDAVAVEHTHFDHRTSVARGHAQRGVADVGGLLAEDGAEELFFRRHRAFALGRDLAHEDVARADFGADMDDARFVEVLERLFRHVRNVAGDFLRPELGVAGHHFVFLDVDRGEDVLHGDLLAEQDRVFEVVAIPRHERDEHVAAEREIAQFGRGTIGDDVAGVDVIADNHQRTLVDAGRLVRTLELHQVVDVDAGLAGIGLFGGADNDTRCVHLVDDALALGDDRGARVTGDDRLHAGAHERGLGTQQRHSLALHVRAHQRAVGVVVLEERDERRGDRDELLGRHVHQVDRFLGRQAVVAGMAGNDEIVARTHPWR